MPQCRNCDSHVTVQFARVFGNNEDVVHRCIDCAPYGTLEDEGGALDEPVTSSVGWTE